MTTKPFNYVKAKGITRRARHQGSLIHDDIVQLLKKEADNILSEDDIKKFKLLMARDPVMKKETKLEDKKTLEQKVTKKDENIS